MSWEPRGNKTNGSIVEWERNRGFMRQINIRSLVLGFGLGLICATLVFALYAYRNELTGTDGDISELGNGDLTNISEDEADRRSDASVSGVNRDELLPVRIIRLDGVTPIEVTKGVSPQPTTAAQPVSSVTVTTTAVTGTGVTTDMPTTTTTTNNNTTASFMTSSSAASTTTTFGHTTAVASTMVAETTTAATTTAAASTSTTVPASTTAATTTAALADDFVSITITDGDTASSVAGKLLDGRLITDADAFVAELIALDLTGELLNGTYNIPVGISRNALIKIITV